MLILASLQVSMWAKQNSSVGGFASPPLYRQVVSEHHLAFFERKTSFGLTSTGVLFLSSKLILFFISMFLKK